MNVLLQISRTETAVTESNSEIYIMIKTDFMELMEQFPIEARNVKREAEEKQNVLMKEKNDMLLNYEARAAPHIIRAL